MTSAAPPLPFLDDPALPLLAEAWSAPRARRLFDRAVLPIALPGRRATAVVIEDVIYQPGRECAVLYRVTLDDRAQRLAVLTLSKDDRLTDVFMRHYATGGEPDRPVVLLPERRGLVEFFALDWRLPALAGAIAPRRGHPIDVLRYRPHRRCVFRQGTTITKVFSDADEAARTLRTLQDLHGAARGSGLLTPAPLALSDGSVLRMQRLEGVALRRGVPESRAALPATAAALAAFHALPVTTEAAPRTLAGELRHLRRRTTRIARVAPRLAAEVDALTDRLERAATRTGPGEERLLHGDFDPSQLLLAPGGVAVVDLDRVGPGDPAVDVGNFMAKAPGHALGELFLAEYVARAPQDGLAVRARLMQAVALARMATGRFLHLPHVYARLGPAWPAARLLEEARRCLST